MNDMDLLLLTVHPAGDDGERPGGGDIEEELGRQTAIQELLMRMSSTYIDIPLRTSRTNSEVTW